MTKVQKGSNFSCACGSEKKFESWSNFELDGWDVSVARHV